MNSVPAEIHSDERLGRCVFSGTAAKRARKKGVIVRDTFLAAKNADSISVDRMDHAPLKTMAALGEDRARQRGSNRQFYGWAIISVSDAESNGRKVKGTPIPMNPYHADIFLNIAEAEIRDSQKMQALELATLSIWRDAPGS